MTSFARALRIRGSRNHHLIIGSSLLYDVPACAGLADFFLAFSATGQPMLAYADSRPFVGGGRHPMRRLLPTVPGVVLHQHNRFTDAKYALMLDKSI